MNKTTVKNVLVILLVLAIATMTACNLATSVQEGSAVEVVMGGIEGAGGARAFGDQASWVKIKVVNNSSGLQVGSGDLDKIGGVWRGKITGIAAGTSTFRATAGSVATEVLWSGSNNTYIVGTNTGIVTITVSAPTSDGSGYGPAGGKVFYDKMSYSDGWRYLEAAPIDQVGSDWSNITDIAIGAAAQGTAIGTGQGNTAAIVGQDGFTDGAAKVCTAYSGGGYTDWFLPSKDELNAMYGKKAAIGGFDPTWYWNSSERVGGSVQKQNFTDGTWQPTGKSYMNRVRAVRAF